ncbi:MAG: hypothetical protein WCS42_10455 [Verrucomicrobiota bacterium]
MARPNIEEEPSEYYPPRARWYGRVFSPWFKLQRLLHLERIHLPAGFTLQQLILSLLLPGYAFFANGRLTLGWSFMGVYFFSAALFIVALGYQLGSLGYGLMISAHASSIIFLEGHWLRAQCEFGLRLLLALITLLAVWLMVYAPLTHLAEAHLIMPLRMRGNVVIVQRLTPPGQIRRGDWIMYSFSEHYVGDAHREGGAAWLQGGYSWGPVLAAAGDRVEFSTNSFSVNGVAQPMLPHMPNRGELVVPENHWFVWPELAITGHGNFGEANLAAVMLQMATVSEVEFVGKPFQHWFGRKQHLYEPVHQS